MAFQRRKFEPIGVKAPLPGFAEPALASTIDKVPSGSRWLHEIKFDGYRVQVYLANETVKIFIRRGHDWTHRFRKVSHDAWHIKAVSAVLAGSAEAWPLMLSGQSTVAGVVAGFILPALVGNLIGGTGLFAVVAHGQVRDEFETGA